MLKNYLKIAFRNLWRDKVYSSINISGLVVGLSTCIVIWLYVWDELSYDSFQTKSERIFRVTQSNIWGDEPAQLDALGPAVAHTLASALPEVELATRLHPDGEFLGTYKSGNEVKNFDERAVLATDANFFQMFDFKLASGSTQEALKNPYSVVLTHETALRYFGSSQALGKSIILTRGKYQKTFKVTGIMRPITANTHLRFDMLIPMYALPQVKEMEWSWIWTTFVTYIRVKPNANIDNLNQKLANLPAKYAEPTIKRIFDLSYQEFAKTRKPWLLKAQSLNEVYLYSNTTGNRVGVLGDIRYVQIFLIVSVLILSISCINFINLSTAGATQRAKEIGLRKVLGSHRKQLIQQFLIEAFLFSFLSFALTLVLLEFLLPTFNSLTGRKLSLWQWDKPLWILIICSLPFVTGFLAGIYPAFYLTRFQPVKVLKGQFQSGKQNKIFRNGLVTFQFTISSVLMISTLILSQQLFFLQEKKLGFDHNKVLILPKVERLGNQLETFKNKLLNQTQIESVGLSDATPPNVGNQDYYKAEQKDAPQVPLNTITTDADYLKTIQIEMIAGRQFSRNFPTDSNHVILNETALRTLGWTKENALGKYLLYNEGLRYKVIGVMKDFHFSSLRFNIEPLGIFLYHTGKYSNVHTYLSLRLSEGSNSVQKTQQTIQNIEKTWKEVAPSLPLEYIFMNTLFTQTYQAEIQVAWVLSVFTGLGIFVAALGLFGLAVFTTERRKKEVGIRKVLGASIPQIYLLLSKEYARLVIIAFLLASPLAYYAMRQWLQDFAYRVPIGLSSFVFPFLLLSLIAAFAVSYQSIKAALVNPVDMLRDE